MDELDRLVGTTVGPYLLEQKLGGGGFGAVFRARHPVLEQHSHQTHGCRQPAAV
jgi:hypothetical protein